MEQQFWHDKWEQGAIGFHLADTNPLLRQYWPKLNLAGRNVFVPLCGKSLDMVYLAGEGHKVVGCELSPIAVNAFFSELDHPAVVSQQGEHKVYQLDEITLYRGDFFTLQPEQIKACRAFYDRAALIALPESMRADYVAQFTRLLPAGAEGLLVTLNYHHPERQHELGPPFAVSEHEVQLHYGDHFEITLLEEQRVLAKNPKFLNNGVEWMTESVYRLKKR